LSHTFSPINSLCLSTRSSSTLYFPQHHLRHSQRHISNAAASLKQDRANRSEHPPSHEAHTASTSTKLSQPSPASSISEQVRLLMRRVPYPVAIITSTDPAGPADITSFRGMTVSSFNTVTLTPEPVISFNVRRPSETLNALLASGRFLVHLLAPSPATATLARDFSKGNTTLAAMLSGHGEFEFGSLSAEQISGGEPERPLPILRRRGSDSDNRLDFPFVFECRLHPQKIDVQDHSIVLGTVLRAIEGSGDLPSDQSCAGVSPDEHSPEHLCLTYAYTKFWKMGGEI
jgi:flavin reductase (DIM6/NTAB) family NADH-FMN oxidoreductase RutF